MSAQLDIEDFSSLLKYLWQTGLIRREEVPLFRNLKGGVSNRVVLVKPKHGKAFVLKQALEKLRVDVDWFCTTSRLEREAIALKHLSEIAPQSSIPKFVFQDCNEHLLAMEEVPEPHQNWKQLLLSGNIRRQHVEQFGALLGHIHYNSGKRKKEMAEIFGDRSVFEALRLEPYYRYTASQVAESAQFMSKLIDDTLACCVSLVHGDYSPKNVLIYRDRLVLLDYEVIHFGDPAFDIGFSMAHFLSKANHLRNYRLPFAQAAVHYWQSYSKFAIPETWTFELEPRSVRHTLACCLARVVGRSPLEYLSPAERTVQASTVLKLLKRPPTKIPELVELFMKHV